jgi:hypothetical protein
MTLFHAIIAIVITAVVCGVLGYIFRGPEADLVEKGKQEAYAEIEKAKTLGKQL